ncbi:unnamed protein product [Amaranthus hypochondriacus]
MTLSSSNNHLSKSVRKEFIMMVEEVKRRNVSKVPEELHHFKAQPKRMSSVIDCFQAAEKYGGFVVCEDEHNKSPDVDKY